MTDVASPENADQHGHAAAHRQLWSPKQMCQNTVPWKRKALDAVQQKAALLTSEHQPSDPLASLLGTATPAYHLSVNKRVVTSTVSH